MVPQDSSSGGQLTSGAYYFSYVYEMEDKSTTSPGAFIGPVSITDGTLKDSTTDYDGSEPGTNSGSSIKLKVSGLDRRYKYIRMIVVKREGGTYTAAYFYRKLIDSDSFTFTYLGNEVHEELDMDEVTVPQVVYDGAKTMTYFNNRLYLGNLRANKLTEFNYQPYANDIRIRWTLDEVEIDTVEGSFKDPYTILTKRGYFPDEVYAFYIRLHFTNGTKSDAFHIPGPSTDDVDPFLKGTGLDGFRATDRIQDIIASPMHPNYRTPYKGENYTDGKSHLQNDLEISEDVRFFQTRETAIDRDYSTNMGLWYNEDEFYPNDPDIWGNLAGQQVRHHKFPAMDMFVNSDSPIISGTGINQLQASNSSDIFLSVDKLSTRARNSNKGESAAIPVTVVSTSDPSVQSQEPITNDSGDRTLYHSCTYISDAHVSFYKKEGSNYSGLFFYNQAQKDITLTISYNISWVYNLIAGGYYNPDVRYRVKVLRYRKDSAAYPYYPIKDTSSGYEEVAGYTIDEFDDVEDHAGIVRSYEGEFDISLDEGDSLSLVLEVFQPEDTGDDPISINAHFYTCDLIVKEKGTESGSSGKGKVLGIDVDNITIPDEIAEQVAGYEILYAKRDSANMRVVGQSLLFGSAQHPLEPEDIGSHAGNHLTTVRSVNNDSISFVPYLRDDLVRFHAFDLLKDKPSVQPSFIKVGAVLNTVVSDIKRIEDKYFDPDTAEDDGRNDEDTPIQAHYRADFVKSRDNGAEDPVKEMDRLRAVKNFKYIAADSIVGYNSENINNTYSEECAIVTVKHPVESSRTDGGKVTNGWLPENSDFYHVEGATSDFDPSSRYYLGSLYVHKTNMYTNLFDQELVSTGKVFMTGGEAGKFSTGKLFGGDTFLSLYGIRLSAALYNDADTYLSINKYEALKTIYYFPCYTVANANLRHSTGELDQSYYPEVGSTYNSYDSWLKRAVDANNSNVFHYNDDYTAVNDIATGYPYDHSEEFLDTFEHRIIRSQVYAPDDKFFNLRKFSVNDFYEMPKHRGPLMNLTVMGSMLLIHMRDSLFRTVSKDSLITETSQIELGTGDIFRIDPTEMTTADNGYGGVTSQRSCVVTPIGYAFVDGAQGKVFLFDGQLKEISKAGNFSFFRDRFRSKLDEQVRSKGYSLKSLENPYYFGGVGFTVAYDPKWERLIVTKKDMTIKPTFLAAFNATGPVGPVLMIRDGVLMSRTNDMYSALDQGDEDRFFDDNSITLSYDLAEQAWVCEHDYHPEIMVSTKNHVFSSKKSKIYLHNKENVFCKYYDDQVYPSFVDVVFNMSPQITKMFQSLQWISEVVDEDGKSYYNETLTQDMVPQQLPEFRLRRCRPTTEFQEQRGYLVIQRL